MKTNRLVVASLALMLSACQHDLDNVDETPSGNALQLMYKDSVYQFTGIAKEANGPLFVSYPRWSETYRYGVVRVDDNATVPFPTLDMNQWQPDQDGKAKWVCVQSLYIDANNLLWVVDPGAPLMNYIQGNGAKLSQIDHQGNVARTYSLMGKIPDTAYLNDVRVDVQRQYAYLSESKGGSLLVINLTTGNIRRVLSNHSSTKSDPSFRFMIDGKELTKGGKVVKVNADGIALTPDGDWLYYKPLTDDKLYRIKTEYLRDNNVSDADLGSKVEDLGHFTTSDGMIFDKSGNLYMGDLQRNRIVKIDQSLKMSTLVQDDRLIWPDSFSIADGFLYVSNSQIQKQPEYNNGTNMRTTPYTVFRWRL